MAAGIFLISAATLLFELTLTRVFSVLFFHHFAFLIISTALFGFGFSGIFLFLRQPQNVTRHLAAGALLFSISALVIYKLILVLPVQSRQIADQPMQIVRLVLYYALLAVPFFFSGYVIGLILRSFPEKSGKYYGFDLAGAALGCIAILWLIPAIGAAGTIVAASVLAAVASLVFRPPSRMLRLAALIVGVVSSLMIPAAEQYFALPLREIFKEKHRDFFRASTREIEFSAWSPVSRIDVLATPPTRLIYLDGGSNVSFILPFKGNFQNLQPRSNHRSVPYMIAPRKTACIIGPGGGEDVLNALSYGLENITAVEMDPLIVKVVQGKYRNFSGGIYDHPSVHVVTDEGRSFLRRSGMQFDLIQTVHNCSPMAFASGAFSLTESYLFTVEAFREYWTHLRAGGMLAINRAGILRAASVASAALQQEGISDPQNYVAVTAQGTGGTGFYLKKGRITEADVQALHTAAKKGRAKVVYAPSPDFQSHDNVYYQLLVPSLRTKLIRNADILLEAPTDNWPFFDHYQRLGSFTKTTTILPEEINPALRFYNVGDLTLFTLLGEAAALSLIFILLPLLRMRKMPSPIPRWAILLYFSAVGAGFILIEISLFQKHILFMGQPVYSIACVLFSLLLSAGAGSSLFQRLFREGRERLWMLSALILVSTTILVETLIVPAILDHFLGEGKVIRFVLSAILIAPMGLVLGIPFPLGIRITGKLAPDLIPWGWALNAYMTVVGSVLCVILALTFGFRTNFLIAWMIYGIGFAALYGALKKS
jgi:spermidine synthase